MSIRTRLVLLCLTLALLPAIPISLVVSDMIDRSFDVGLNRSVSDALQGGMAISRKHLERLREDFERDSQVNGDSPPGTCGFIIVSADNETTNDTGSHTGLPEGLGQPLIQAQLSLLTFIRQ